MRKKTMILLITIFPLLIFGSQSYPFLRDEPIIWFVGRTWGGYVQMRFLNSGNILLLTLSGVRETIGDSAIYKIYRSKREELEDKKERTFFYQVSNKFSDGYLKEPCLLRAHLIFTGRVKKKMASKEEDEGFGDWYYIHSPPVSINEGEKLIFLMRPDSKAPRLPFILDRKTGKVKQFKMRSKKFPTEDVPLGWREKTKKIIFLRKNDCHSVEWSKVDLCKKDKNQRELWEASLNMNNSRKIIDIPNNWNGVTLSPEGEYLIFAKPVFNDEKKVVRCGGLGAPEGVLMDIRIMELETKKSFRVYLGEDDIGYSNGKYYSGECIYSCKYPECEYEVHWSPSGYKILWRVEKENGLKYKVIYLEKDKDGKLSFKNFKNVYLNLPLSFAGWSYDEESIYMYKSEFTLARSDYANVYRVPLKSVETLKFLLK